MKAKRRWLAMLLLCVMMICPTQALAAENDFVVDIPSSSARSYDSSFTLDFTTSAGWTINFDNNAFAVWNHRYINVDYESCSPHSTTAQVEIRLYIDEDEDGVYELYDPNGGYTFQLEVGDMLRIALPYENTVKKYRLMFVNLTSSISSGTFTVTTSRD